jgi:hypothetical protein
VHSIPDSTHHAHKKTALPQSPLSVTYQKFSKKAAKKPPQVSAYILRQIQMLQSFLGFRDSLAAEKDSPDGAFSTQEEAQSLPLISHRDPHNHPERDIAT